MSVTDSTISDQEIDSVQEATANMKRDTKLKPQLTLNRSQGNKLVVEYNDKGKFMGKTSVELTSYLGFLGRTMVPIVYEDWRQVPDELKENLWDCVQSAFVVDLRSREHIMSSIRDKFRLFKNTLFKSYVLPFKDQANHLKQPPLVYSYIELNQWLDFVASKLSEEFDKIEIQRKRQAKDLNDQRLTRKRKAGAVVDLKCESQSAESSNGSIPRKKTCEEDDDYEEGLLPWTGHDTIPISSVGATEHPGQLKGVGLYVMRRSYFRIRSYCIQLQDEYNMIKHRVENFQAEMKALKPQSPSTTQSDVSTPHSDVSCSNVQNNLANQSNPMEQGAIKEEIKKELVSSTREPESESAESMDRSVLPKKADKMGNNYDEDDEDTLTEALGMPEQADQVEWDPPVSYFDLIESCLQREQDQKIFKQDLENMEAKLIRWQQQLAAYTPHSDDSSSIVQQNFPAQPKPSEKAIGSQVMWLDDVMPITHFLASFKEEKKEPTSPIESEIENPNDIKTFSKLVAYFMDGIASYKFKFDRDVFGEESSTLLSREDMENIINSSKVSTKSMCLYIWFLQDELKAYRMDGRFRFVNPSSISICGLIKPSCARKIANCLLKTNQDELVFVPFSLGNYWALVVIDPAKMRVYYIDPLELPPGEDVMEMVNGGWKMFAEKKNPEKSTPSWIAVECPKSKSNYECGYFVMRYMNAILANPKLLVSNFNGCKTYSQAEIDEVRLEWAKFALDLLCTKIYRRKLVVPISN